MFIKLHQKKSFFFEETSQEKKDHPTKNFSKMNDSILKEYEIGPFLGKGTFGSVYKATKRSTLQTVAIKCIDMSAIHQKNDEHAAEKILSDLKLEEKLLTDISDDYSNGHPHIVLLYESLTSKTTGNLYLVMEHCEGGDLHAFMKQHGPLSVDVSRRLLRELAKALQCLRSMNIIHRDLKPQNLLVTSMDLNTATIKVADFGLARNLRPQDLASTCCG